METLLSAFNFPKSPPPRPAPPFITPPPADFDFRVQTCHARIKKLYPELIDIVDKGNLVLIEKEKYGPVPAWRSDFVEPEEIWLVGCDHLGEESSGEVERVVMAVRPENVVVELCRSRAGIMYVSSEGVSGKGGPQLKSNMFALTGAGFFEAVGRSINLGGQTALALRLLLAIFSSKISSDVNRPFGDEFCAARKASEKVGAQIVLGDRPIEITLERAWNSLKWKEKVNLVSSVFRGISSSSADTSDATFKEAESKDEPFELYKQLSYSYPSLLQPLIHERDTYLSWSLKRSKAVGNCKKVVGVIGKGHMNGVIYALISDLGDLRFSDLCGKRSFSNNSNGWVDSLLKNLIRDAIIGIVLWFIFEQLKTG